MTKDKEIKKKKKYLLFQPESRASFTDTDTDDWLQRHRRATEPNMLERL